MGQKLSYIAPSAPTIAISSYIDALGYSYIEILNNSRFLRTIKALDSNGDLVIIKILIKPTTTNINLQEIIQLLIKQSSILHDFNNILTYDKFIETDRAGYMIRQMLKTNLYDRLSIRPFLEPIEKLFIIYQIITIVDNLHSNNIHHGDLRLENFLCSSWNWIYLTDFSNIIKPVYIPEDNPNQFSFYFDSSDRRVCYIAPERFYKSKDFDNVSQSSCSINDSMDLFSLGCIIGEIYNDGDAIFNLSQLYKFMKNEFKPDFKNVETGIVEIIEKLIKLNPSERVSAREILNEQQNLFPSLFNWLYKFLESFNKLQNSDDRLLYIYDNFENISNQLGFTYDYSENSGILPMRLNLPSMPTNYQIKSNKYSQSTIIILHATTTLLNTLSKVSLKIKACDLIVSLSEYITDESKLDRSIPYLCSYLDDEIVQVLTHALYSITTILLTVTKINPINTSFFIEYLLPKLHQLLSKSDIISSTIAIVLPYLSTVAKKFYILSKSFNTTIEISKMQLDNKFKEITLNLLTGSTTVKCSLLSNILPLCQFFGIAKTNDIILPHLISYLNDNNTQLRITFLDSILQISNYIGAISFKTYILPILLDSLKDKEELVRLKILQIFINIVKDRLIIDIDLYQELIQATRNFLIDKNEYLKQNTVVLILCICENMTYAEKFCILYPLIKNYLVYDIPYIDWNTLYPCIKKK
ncbi:unnamed protein product [Candida verbasci]|uniref:Protein kinase domain-containing protein n=1 Tax=Candida verbasci TaxID=1227364 RepID=A0A9W4XNJ6_9ASCO|nr:unnamed protein product [Candida verbasci]